MASERPSRTELLAAGAGKTWGSTGSAIAKPVDAVRSAGTLETHPVLTQGLEPAFPCFGQHGCESAADWETMAAQATDAKPTMRTMPIAKSARAKVRFVLAISLIASHNIARCAPKPWWFQVLRDEIGRLGTAIRLRHIAQTSAPDILRWSQCLLTSKSALSAPATHQCFGGSGSLP